MTEESSQSRPISAIRLSLVQSFLESCHIWEKTYKQRGEKSDNVVKEFKDSWGQIEPAYDWAVKYMPKSDEWKSLYCQLTFSLTYFWRLTSTVEDIQRKWLLCAVKTSMAIKRYDLKLIFVERLADLFYDSHAFRKSIFYYDFLLRIIQSSSDNNRTGNLLTSKANSIRDSKQDSKSSKQSFFEDAEAFYQEALSLKPDDLAILERIYSNYGILKVRLDQPDEAVKLFLQALSIALQIGDLVAQRRSLGNLSSAYQNLGNFVEAMKCATKAIEVADQTREPRGQSQAYASRGFIHRKQGRLDDALRDFNKAFGIAKEAKLLLIAARQADNEAEIYFVQGDLIKAVQQSEFAYKIAFDRNVVREIGFHGYTHGWNLIALKRYLEAIEVLSNVVAQVGGQATMQALVTRGIAYHLDGKCDLALQDVNKAILQAKEAVSKSAQYKAWQVIGLGEVCKILCGAGDIENAFQAYKTACSINGERGSVERQYILLNYVDPDKDHRLNVIRDFLLPYFDTKNST